MATKTLNKLLLAESSAYTGAAKNNKSRRLKGLTNIPHPNPRRFSTGVFPVNEPRNCVKGFWNGVKWICGSKNKTQGGRRKKTSKTRRNKKN